MYCSNCGKSISDEEFQRNGAFCDTCAGITETSQKPARVDESVAEVPKMAPVAPQRPIQGDKPGRYSKKSLVFGLLSILFMIAGLIIGNMGRRYNLGLWYMSYPLMLTNSSIVTILHIIGLIFGVTAKKNKDRASMYEVGNPIRTTGGIFGLNGIIFNAILMALAVVFLVIAIIAVLPSPFYYY